jgi:hypothetical protein
MNLEEWLMKGSVGKEVLEKESND